MVAGWTGLWPLPAGAADWAQWRGPLRTGHVPTGERVPDRLPATPRVVWKLNAGDGLASPVVSQGRVFVFDNQAGKETLRALDAASGNELWRQDVDAPFSDGQGPTGPRCTPLVDGDRVYAQSCKGELQCRSVTDGRLRWRVNFTNDFGAVFIGEKGTAQGASRHGYNGPPVIDGEHLIAAVGGTNGAGLVCFEKRSGHVVWKSQNDPAAYAAPMIATFEGVRQVVSFSVDGVLGVERHTGELLWRMPVRTAYGRHVTAPVIHPIGVIVSSHQMGLIAVRLTKDTAGFKSEPAWISREAAMNFSCPVAVGDHLFGLGPEKNLVCVEIATGKLKWSKPGYFTTSADKANAAFLVLGRNLLVLTDGGELVLLEADPVEGKELGRVQVCGLNWSNPAYADGRLYLRDGIKGGTAGHFYCLDLLAP
jgi:outer membrane protein assembly factor BamB